jgi:hypothetical protein
MTGQWIPSTVATAIRAHFFEKCHALATTWNLRFTARRLKYVGRGDAPTEPESSYRMAQSDVLKSLPRILDSFRKMSRRLQLIRVTARHPLAAVSSQLLFHFPHSFCGRTDPGASIQLRNCILDSNCRSGRLTGSFHASFLSGSVK